MKIIIQNATIYVNAPETAEEERKEETKEEEDANDAEPAPETREEPPGGVIETAKKKKFPVPVNSPESFAICRRIAEEERNEKRPRKPRTKITPSIEERVREMTKEGLSIRTQADALGVSPASVQRIRKRQEIEEKYGH